MSFSPLDVLHLSLRQLQVFVAVARAGSTAAAAGTVALSQSATSSALNELERVLTVPLFDRLGKRLQLNDNGRELLPRALAVLDGAGAIERIAQADAAAVHALRIGASTTVGNYMLPALLARLFRPPAQAPQARFASRVAIANTAAVCEAVAAFELDIGLVEGPPHLPSLEPLPWVEDELVLVAAPTPEAPPTGRLALRALREALWLLREPGSGTREITDQALLPHILAYRRSIELGSSEAIKRAAVAGLGVACLSNWVVADDLAAGRLRRVAAPLAPIKRQCYLVVQRAKLPTPALRAFVQAARAQVRPGA